MKPAAVLFVPLLLAYLTITAAFVLLQRKLIYFPGPLDGTTPRAFSLEFEDVRFPSSKGVTLNGWWAEHPGPKAKRPVVLYCHGNAANLSYLAEVMRLFYDYGFDVFLFDYRGYGASGKGPLSEEGLAVDAKAAYGWLLKKGIPEGRIIVWGQSLGSGVAARLAAGTNPAGLVLEGAFPSVYSMSREKYPWLLIPPFLVWDKFETAKYAAERSCPLLQMHMEKDEIVPVRLGRKVFEKAAEPKEWLLVEGIGHNDYPSVAMKYKKPVMDFVGKCLSSHPHQ